MNARALAQEATSWYLSKVDPLTPHAQNVAGILRSPVLQATLKVLAPQTVTQTVTQTQTTTKEQEFSQAEWSNKWDQQAYNGLERRNKARMDAFLKGISLAVPDDPCPSNNKRKGDGTKHGQKSPIISSIQEAVRSSKSMEYPQIRAAELAMRLELYLRCCCCQEPSIKFLKARAMGIVRAFVATVGCVTSVGPTLTQLLETMTKEVLCVDTLSGEVTRVIRRVVSEYEHQVSFASLAFLSSPEDSAEHRLAPMVLSYLQYIQQNWERIVQDCEMERLLMTVLNQRMRNLFKTIEFQSIGHLLEVCQGFSCELQNIQLPPDMCSRLGSTRSASDDTATLKQAIRDLQREVLTVNGHALPSVHTRKELVQLLSQTLNSRSLFRRKWRSERRIKSSLPTVNPQSESEGPFSSGNEGDIDGSGRENNGQTVEIPKRRVRTNRRQSFQLNTVDVMTRRLLVASSRTGLGGDAYFIVRDLFGGENVEVVPSREQVRQRLGTIEIVVRLSSVTIKCHASFDVYPKFMVGGCEPLIQLHTTTTETINLQEVRQSDSEDGMGRIDNQSSSDDNSNGGNNKLVLQEKRTDKTGWRTISIRPALYEAVGEWNTPS